MKPAPFEYLAPASVDEAVGQLAQHGGAARVLAGGQSLVRLMNTRVETPSVIVDINRIPGLDAISADGGTVTIGALARQHAVQTSDVIATHAPLLAEAGHEVGHASVRERGTFVGSIAFADPAAELPTALVALDGEVVARGAKGERAIPASEFFTGPWRNALADDELAVAVRVPATAGGSAFVEATRRHGELPMCGVATVVEVRDGTIASARIALGGVGDRPVRASRAEQSLVGQKPTAEAIAAAADQAANEIDPPGDSHAGADFRRHLAGVLTRRSLERAVSRA